MAKRRSLGRGLEALLSTETGPAGVAAREGLREVPVDLLERGRYQPRSDMREESLAELAESIRAQGMVQPIVVRPLPGDADSTEARYEIVAGERRWRAAQLAGLHSVPALVRTLTDHEALAIALIENIKREDLNPLEEASALHRLVDEFGMTHADAAAAVGRARASVSNLLRLLELPDAVKEFLAQRALDMGHARALLALPSRGAQLALAQRIVKEGWSVREAERAVKRLSQQRPNLPRTATGASEDPDVKRLETRLGERLGASVRVEHRDSGGRVIIRYHSVEELEGIIDHFVPRS